MPEPTGASGVLGQFLQNYMQASIQRRQIAQSRAMGLMQLAQMHAHIADTTPRGGDNDAIIDHSRQQVGSLLQQADKLSNQKSGAVALLSKIPGISHALGLNKPGGKGDGSTPQPSVSTAQKDQILGHSQEHETGAPLPSFDSGAAASPLSQPQDQSQGAQADSGPLTSGLPPQEAQPDVTGQTPPMEQPPTVDTTGQPGLTSGLPAQPGSFEGQQGPAIGRPTPLPKRQAPSITAGATQTAAGGPGALTASTGAQPPNTLADEIRNAVTSLPNRIEGMSDADLRSLKTDLLKNTVEKHQNYSLEIRRLREAGQIENANKLQQIKDSEAFEDQRRANVWTNQIEPAMTQANMNPTRMAIMKAEVLSGRSFNIPRGTTQKFRDVPQPDGTTMRMMDNIDQDSGTVTSSYPIGPVKGPAAEEQHGVKLNTFISANKDKYTKKDGTVDRVRASQDFAKSEEGARQTKIEKDQQSLANQKQMNVQRTEQIKKLKEYNTSKSDGDKRKAATGLLNAARAEAKAKVSEDPSLRQADVLRQILSQHIVDGKSATEEGLQAIIGKTTAATPAQKAAAAFGQQSTGMEKPPLQPKGTPVTP